jgi:uncharacterized membrane protein (DUF106 family)
MASTYLSILNQLLIDQDRSEAQQLIDEFKRRVSFTIRATSPR